MQVLIGYPALLLDNIHELRIDGQLVGIRQVGRDRISNTANSQALELMRSKDDLQQLEPDSAVIVTSVDLQS